MGDPWEYWSKIINRNENGKCEENSVTWVNYKKKNTENNDINEIELWQWEMKKKMKRKGKEDG